MPPYNIVTVGADAADAVIILIGEFNTTIARLPSNLRPITRECVHLVTHGHFRSRDKYGGYTIRSAVAETSYYTQTSRLYVS